MKESDEEPIDTLLGTIQKLLQSLPGPIARVQILKVKWSLIAAKLAALESRLSELSVSASGAGNSLSSDLLSSIFTTCSAATSLAVLCHSLTPAGGKLRTQNDVDSLSAKLDAHINDLEVLTKSGVLAGDTAADSSAIASSNGRESVRAEARYLVTRLQIGTTESKSSALDLLLGLLQEDDKNVLTAVAQGIVPILVHLLDSCSSSDIKEKTATAIAKISTVHSTKHVLIAEGLVLLNNLMRVLESGSVFAKEKSCIALKVLSNSKENASAIGSRGGISSLLEICQEGTPNSQAVAAGVLRNLAVFEEIKENFIEENAVSILLTLSNSGTMLAQENSIGCLCNLVSKNDDLKLVVAREGGIESLKNLWDSANNPQNLEVVVLMVEKLSSCPNIAEFLVSNGFLNRIVGVLNCGVLGVRIAAARALFHLAYGNRIRKELGELGCILPLVSMLDGKSVEEKEAAGGTLSLLMDYAGNRRIFRKEEKGIVFTVQLLNPLTGELERKPFVSILASLVYSKKCRKQMVAAGACGYLQKLVEMNVEGAKKLLDSLGRGKLWGVFGRP